MANSAGMTPEQLREDGPPWAKYFMELALRAIRRVHYEYGLWSIGQHWLTNQSEPHLLNMGYGIELADEPTVCAAITQEYLSSPLVAGGWVDATANEEVGNGFRYWRIDREQSYANGSKRVDICIQRYKKAENGKPAKSEWKPAFIEAKRARRWTAKISTGKATAGDRSYQEIKDKDIAKLRNEIKARKKNGEGIFCHLLVWDAWDTTQKSEIGPQQFFNKLGDKDVILHQVRWLPISWKRLAPQEFDKLPAVEKWLWIALAEVRPKDESTIE